MSKSKISIVSIVLISMGILIVANSMIGRLGADQSLIGQMNLFSNVLRLVKVYYVDEVDSEKLVNNAIQGMLGTLDPHTHLILPKQYEDMDERMIKGSYEGIGIAFDIVDGYITVISPIEGSPSDRLGIRAGDRIVKIDGESVYGITTDEVYQKLRGPSGSSVNVSIRREGEQDLLEMTIIRDTIKIKSIPSAFMVRPGTGYVRLSRFARETGDDLEVALDSLEEQGMQRLILDLRGNAGGFLTQAVEIADKFIPEGNRIVYTKGRSEDSEEYYYSTREATHPLYPLIVMINRGSASASEIVAGAIQDLDRGLVVGETSYGKGLVENPYKLKDDSVLMLTIGRWYTPSGRLIQKPYSEKYRPDAEDDSTAAISTDDTTAAKPVFSTVSGREVIGGGGIKPDVELDTDERYNRFVNALETGSYFFDFATSYAASHTFPRDFSRFNEQPVVTEEMYLQFQTFLREKGFQFKNDEFLDDLTIEPFILEDMRALLKKNDVQYTSMYFEKNKPYIQYAIKREIAKNLWGLEEWYMVFANNDPQVLASLELFGQASELMAMSRMNR